MILFCVILYIHPLCVITTILLHVLVLLPPLLFSFGLPQCLLCFPFYIFLDIFKRWKCLWRMVGDSGTPSDIACCGSVCIKEQTVVIMTKKKTPVKHYSGFWLKLLSNLKRVWECECEWECSSNNKLNSFLFLNYWLYSFMVRVWRERLFHNKTIECWSQDVSLLFDCCFLKLFLVGRLPSTGNTSHLSSGQKDTKNSCCSLTSR